MSRLHFSGAHFTACVGMALILLGNAGTASAAGAVVAGRYFENAGAGCTAGSFCDVLFSPIPSGKRLEVERISCSITEQQNRLASVEFGVRGSTGNVARQEYLQAPLLGGTAGVFRHVVNSEVDTISLGARPMLHVVSDLVTTFVIQCQINGRLLAL